MRELQQKLDFGGRQIRIQHGPGSERDVAAESYPAHIESIIPYPDHQLIQWNDMVGTYTRANAADSLITPYCRADSDVGSPEISWQIGDLGRYPARSEGVVMTGRIRERGKGVITKQVRKAAEVLACGGSPKVGANHQLKVTAINR